MKKNGVLVLLMASLLLSVVAGCAPKQDDGDAAKTTLKAEITETDAVQVAETKAPQPAAKSIILSTTTSTNDSGLLDAILPDFTEETGIEVKVVAVGTGAALANGEEGNCDLVLVHAKSAEEAFVENGFGLERFDVMYNDFVLVGPKDDPLEIGKNHKDVTRDALKAIAEAGSTSFVSRGDDSGTHKKELAIWAEVDLTPKGDWYVEAGQGMGAVLTMANELEAYTLTDRATYLAYKDELSLVIVNEGDQALLNQYGVIAVNPETSSSINADGADLFIKWLLSEETQAMIAAYGVEEFGQPLFVPNAK